MKPGYRQTKVGVIPSNWDLKPLGELGVVRMCKRVFKHQTREYGDVPFYKIGTFGGVADAFIPQSLFDEFRLKYSFPRRGDILISAAGTIGRTVAYDGAPAYFQDSNIVWIDNDESEATNAYLWHRLQVTKWSVSHGGTVARLYNDSLRTKILIPIPPLPEQHAIAEALGDMDSLIAALEKLITKKRNIKQAVMQQLLTGKTRLPGFTGKWKVRRLDELARLYQPETIAQSAFTTEGYPVYGANGVVGRYSEFNHQTRQITVSCRGNCGTVNRTSGPSWITGNAMVVNLDATPTVHPDFVFYSLCLADLTVLASGSGIPQITREPLGKFKVCLPESAEQLAIAKVLTDIDEELSLLEKRLAKTRNIKRAMMQELLTGKTRLV